MLGDVKETVEVVDERGKGEESTASVYMNKNKVDNKQSITRENRKENAGGCG